MPVIEHDEVCGACKGTGLFQGMAERGDVAVQCHDCKGTGCFTFRREYEEFRARVPREDVARVIKVNPGICVGGPGPERFGGMPYKDWAAGKPFPARSEMREYTCPVWWYQSADYNKKPEWDVCSGTWNMFSECANFKRKAKCWAKWDKENP